MPLPPETLTPAGKATSKLMTLAPGTAAAQDVAAATELLICARVETEFTAPCDCKRVCRKLESSRHNYMVVEQSRLGGPDTERASSNPGNPPCISRHMVRDAQPYRSESREYRPRIYLSGSRCHGRSRDT